MLPWALLVLVILAVVYLGIGLFVAAQFTAPFRQPVKRTPADVNLLDFREVSFKSSDGLDLKAWWIQESDSSRAAVLVHGFGGDKSDRHVIETAPIYVRAGYSVLMLDLRANGGSEGNRRTLGYQEVQDVQGVLAWLEERGFEPKQVVLHGWSMGAATVVRSAPGTGVAAVVEEAGYADLPLLLRDAIPKSSGLPTFFNPGILLMAKLFLGADPWAVRPQEEAQKLSEEGVPLLIIHSADDEEVPFEHARRFKAAYPDVTLWKIEGYDHAQAYTHPEYEEQLLGFLESENRL